MEQKFQELVLKMAMYVFKETDLLQLLEAF